MDRFAMHIRDAELARVSLDKEKPEFEKEKIELEANEKERD